MQVVIVCHSYLLTGKWKAMKFLLLRNKKERGYNGVWSTLSMKTKQKWFTRIFVPDLVSFQGNLQLTTGEMSFSSFQGPCFC